MACFTASRSVLSYGGSSLFPLSLFGQDENGAYSALSDFRITSGVIGRSLILTPVAL